MKNLKFKLTLLCVGVLIAFSALFALTSDKVDAADEYATSWKMSEGKSFQVISGNLGTNTSGSPYEIESGAQSNFFVMYSTMPADPNGPDLIEAGKFALRIKLPGDFDGNLGRVANDNWTMKEGTVNDPNGTPTGSESDRYYWLINAVDMPLTSSDTLTLILTPFKNGITADETSFPFSVSLMNLNNNTNVSGDTKSSFVANTEKFAWSNASMAISGQNQTFTRKSTETAGDITASDFAFRVTATPNPNNVNYDTNSAVFGTSFAKSVNFKNTYQLPMDATDPDCALLTINESMFVDESGNPFPPGTVTLIRNALGNVTGFTIDGTVNNPSQTAQFASPNFYFKIKAPIINGSCPSLANMEAGNTKTFAITQTANSHEVEPLVKLDASRVLNDNNKLNIGQAAMPAFNFTYKVVNEEAPLDSYKDPVKSVLSIGGKATSSMTPPYTAYPGDTIRYELGAEHIQNKNTNTIRVSYEETAGVDYDPSKMVPLRIVTGDITPIGNQKLFNVEIYYTDGTSSITNTTWNQTINIDTTKEVKSFKVFSDIPAGYPLNRGYYVDFMVLDQKDLSKDGMLLKNTVNQTYKNGDTEKKAKASADVTYKLKPLNGAGLFESNKSGINLAGGNPKGKDVVEFVIYLTNDHGADLKVDEVMDFYTNNTLSPYNGTTTKVDGSDAINSKLLNNNNAMNLVLWDKNPTNSSNSPISFPGGEPTIVDNNGLINIKFNNDIVIPAGQTYYLTYTMSVKDSFNFSNQLIGNSFNSYYDGFKNGEGVFYWTGAGSGSGIDADGNGNGSYNKWHKNASVPKSITNPWYSAPYGGDIVLYTSRITNNSGSDWNGGIELTDTFSEELQRYDADTGFNTGCTDCDKLNLDNPYNLAALPNGTSATIRGLQTPMQVATNASSFDPSKVTVAEIDSNSFKVNLGDNVIKSGESVVLVYTLQVKPNVSPTDDNANGTKENEIENSCVVTYNGNPRGNCSDTWYVNAKEGVQGVVDLTKGVKSVSNNHPVTRVENGDEITYKVTMSNNHIKADRYISIESLIDSLPSNLKYKEGSFNLKFFTTEYPASGNVSQDPDDYIKGEGVKEEKPLPTGANNYTLEYVDTNSDGKKDSIKVVWNNPIELTAGEYTDDTFQKLKTFSYEYEYTVTADTTDMPENEGLKDQTNTVRVFTTNSKGELVQKNGTIVDDTTSNLDGKDTSKSYIEQKNTVKLLNDNYNYGSVVKTVTSGNAAFNLDAAATGRSYKIVISNTGAKDYTISRFVDIAPIYEDFNIDSISADGTVLDASKITVNKFSNSSSEVKQSRIIYNGDLVVPAGKTLTITYNTTVDKDTIVAKMKAEQNNSIPSLSNNFGFYMKNNVNLTLSGGGSTAIDNEGEASGNWDDDTSTAKRYQATVAVSYVDNSIVPGVDIAPLVVLDNGTTQNYIQNVTPINPGDSVAWKIRIGNASNASSVMLPGTKVVVVLPEGVTFDENNATNQYIASTPNVSNNIDGNMAANKNKPSWLSDPEITINDNGQQVLVWTINSGNFGANNGLGFTIRTATEAYKFTSYAPEVYFVPVQQSNQDFYENMLVASGNNLKNLWPGYKHEFADISNMVSSLEGESHYVKDSTFIDVYGAYGLSAYKIISNEDSTVTSRHSDRVLNLDSRSQDFKYTLRLEAVKNDTQLANLVFIDRLPSVGDISVITDSKRNSEAAVRLKENGNVKVVYKETDKSAQVTLDDSQYDIEYFFGECNEPFTNNDKEGVSQPTRWLSAADVEAGDKGYSKATAFRVVITDPAIKIAAMGEMEVSFDAQLGEKVEDYKVSGKVAVNNFGYKLDYGVAQNLLKSEVVSVGVAADVPDSQATIVKNVDLDGHTDASSRSYFESIEKNRLFDFTLIGKDSAGVKQYEHDFEINSNNQNASGYTGTTLIENLDPSLDYSLVEKDNPNFSANIAVSSKIVNDQTQYTFTVTNTWQPVQLKVDKNWLDPSGVKIADANLTTLLKDYVKNAVIVDLYNSANTTISLIDGSVVAKDNPATPDVDESTLPVNSLKIGSVTVSLTSLSANFGYVNQYDDLGTKIVYAINEDATTLDYDIFSVNSSFKQEDAIGTFTLNNQIAGGDVKLIKKDDLENTLAGVEFTLSDPLGIETVYTTDKNGEITITNLMPGAYSFEETKVPTGYTGITKPVTFDIEPAATEVVQLNVENKIIRGSVELTKTDDLNNLLPGAVFELYTDKDVKVGTTYTTDKDGIITVDNLVPGNYYFKEISAPEGYTKSSTNTTFTVVNNPSTAVKVSVENKIVRGSVELTKTDDLNNLLPGAVFELYTDKDVKIGATYTTDKDGIITVDNLVPGAYYFKEISAPEGYTKSSTNATFTIEHNASAAAKVSVENKIVRGSVELTKTDDLNNLLPEAVFELYTDKDVKVGSTYTTDKDGIITVDNLVPGAYYFKEISAPEGYTKSNVNTEFTIEHNPSTTVKVSVENKIVRGSVELTKQDDLNNLLPGAVFELYTDKDVKVGATYTTDKDGIITVDNLVPGDYYFKEISAPVGYTKSSTNATFTIEHNASAAAKVSVENKIVRGSVELTKKDDLNNLLPGAVFELYTDKDVKVGSTYTTDKDGIITVDNLVPGAYYFKEISAPEGYTKSNINTEFTIEHNPSATVKVSVENKIVRGSVELTKTDDLNNLLPGAVFELYTDKDVKVGSTYTTDKDGIITVDNLVPGDYYFKEISAPEGYIKSNTNAEFTIEHNPSSTVKVSVENKIIRGSVELIKKDDLNNLLANAEFELYTTKDVKIESIHITKASGALSVDNLVPGDYYFTEIKAPEGYTKSNEKINFTIAHNPKTTVQVVAENKIIRGDVELTKLDEANKVLSGAEFELYDNQSKQMGTSLTTDENGKIAVDNLVPGDYFFKEIKAPEGYLMMPTEEQRTYKFTIPFNPSETVKVEAYNYLPLELDPPIKKEVDGANAPDSKFEFEMVGSNGAPMPEGSTDNKKVVKAGAGGIEFGKMTYTEVGEYTYTLKEIKGTDSRFTYDKSQYTMNVSITFNGRNLEMKVEYLKDGSKYTGKEIIFTNKYVEPQDIKAPKTGQENILMAIVAFVSGCSILGYQLSTRNRRA